MKTFIKRFQALAAALVVCLGSQTLLHAQGTAFTYQGRLTFNGSPVTGNFDFQFILFNVSQFGFPASPILTNTAVPVNNGLFTTTLNFGPGIFTGSNYWLDISVRTNGGSAPQFIEMSPRQLVTPSPYSIFATTASNLSGTLPVGQLNGIIPLNQLPPGLITNNQPSVTLNGSFVGNFSGNGGTLTNLQLSALGSPGTFSPLTLYFGPGATYATAGPPLNLAVTDVNGDGKPDLVCAGGSSLTILTNNGNGTFSSNATLTTGIGALFVAVVTNADGHGHMALVSANANASTLSVFTNNGSGVFSLSQTITGVSQPECVQVVSNYDGQGHQAIVSANAGANTLTVFTNNGSGIFSSNATLSVGSLPFFVAVADVNGDGKPDLISANVGNHTLTILTNNGSGVFGFNGTLSTFGNAYSIATADVNGDGNVDLITSDYTLPGYLTVYFNNGSGGFSVNNYYQVGNGSIYVVAADVNGDGKPDLISANFSAQTMTVLTNDGTGNNFGFYQTVNVGAVLNSLAAADLNNDGRVDLVSANRSLPNVSVFLNLPSPVPGLFVNGAISSPMWQVSSVINFQGGLPAFGSFNSNGGTLLIFVTASGFAATANTQIGMDIQLDGKTIDSSLIFASSTGMHLTFVPAFIRTGARPGIHSISLLPRSGTSTDGNDFVRVLVQELPF